MNLLAIVVVARLGRRLSGTEHERLPAPERDTGILRAPPDEQPAPDPSAVGEGAEHERRLRESAEVGVARD